MKKLQQLHDRAALAISPVALVIAQVNIKPDKSKAPGAKGLEDVVNGFAWYALIAAAGGIPYRRRVLGDRRPDRQRLHRDGRQGRDGCIDRRRVPRRRSRGDPELRLQHGQLVTERRWPLVVAAVVAAVVIAGAAWAVGRASAPDTPAASDRRQRARAERHPHDRWRTRRGSTLTRWRPGGRGQLRSAVTETIVQDPAAYGRLVRAVWVPERSGRRAPRG